MSSPVCPAIMPTRDSKVPPWHSLDCKALSKGPDAVYTCAFCALKTFLGRLSKAFLPHIGRECSCNGLSQLLMRNPASWPKGLDSDSCISGSL